MAEYQTLARPFRAAGFELAALSVDDPGRSDPVRQRLKLSFPILCDQTREVLIAWDLLNDKERGGIAVPGVFVLNPDRQVLYRWLDTTTTRVTAEGVLATVRGQVTDPERRVRLGLGSMVMAIGNTIRRGGTTPRE